MDKAFIFGASPLGKRIYNQIKDDYEVIGFIDNNIDLYNENIFPVNIVKEKYFDKIFIASQYSCDTMISQLIELGVPINMIKTTYIDVFIEARNVFLKNFASVIQEKKIRGSVAEAGVFKGEFAKQINKLFPNKKLYLFDTFEGFDPRDVEIEQKNNYSRAMEKSHSDTSEDLVLSKMKYRDMCVIRKGYFPETTKGLENEQFCFVNLDMDMYEPTLNGLMFFYPRMISMGVILIHDYYSLGWTGVKYAVYEFEKSQGDLIIFPIGDGSSIAIIKK